MSALALVDSSLDFVLPPELEATEPAEVRGSGRDDVRLMVSNRQTDEITHPHFRELPRFLSAGDLLVLNTTATSPAALTARRASGERFALHVSTSLPAGLTVVEPRNVAPASAGGHRQPNPRVSIDAGESVRLPEMATATFLGPYRDSTRLWVARLDLPLPLRDYLRRHGRPVTYSYIRRQFPIAAYQTVFAEVEGSAEMPSAGRPFTRPMIRCLRAAGVGLAKIVLHAGVASLENHEQPYEEYFEVPAKTATAVRETREKGGRVVAVGTTVVRALESSLDTKGEIIATRGWTDVVITPERGLRVVDGLLTGFHEPRATHLAMLMALAGREHVGKAYRQAIDHGYLWHEFGDVHLIL
jgi:S-adenosylmethionine:tRNA ribosyltransferase-isomerase